MFFYMCIIYKVTIYMIFRQEEMYQVLISNYEEKQQELRVENSDLRDCLLDMQRELSSLVDHSDTTLTGVPQVCTRLLHSYMTRLLSWWKNCSKVSDVFVCTVHLPSPPPPTDIEKGGETC